MASSLMRFIATVAHAGLVASQDTKQRLSETTASLAVAYNESRLQPKELLPQSCQRSMDTRRVIDQLRILQ